MARGHRERSRGWSGNIRGPHGLRENGRNMAHLAPARSPPVVASGRIRSEDEQPATTGGLTRLDGTRYVALADQKTAHHTGENEYEAIADYHRGSTRSLATGLHMSGIYAGIALGGMGGWMADNHGWSSGFSTFGGAVADRCSRTARRGRVRVPMIALALASPFVLMTAHTDALWFAVICLIVFGFARGCSDSNMMPILCQVVQPQQRATGYGILNFVSCCIGGVAAYLGGWLKERHVDLSYLLMGSGLCVLVCALLLILVKPRRYG
jgi:hypothetical protein